MSRFLHLNQYVSDEESSSSNESETTSSSQSKRKAKEVIQWVFVKTFDNPKEIEYERCWSLQYSNDTEQGRKDTRYKLA